MLWACEAGLCAAASSGMLHAPSLDHLKHTYSSLHQHARMMRVSSFNGVTPVHPPAFHTQPARRQFVIGETSSSALQLQQGIGQLLRNDNSTIAVGGHRGMGVNRLYGGAILPEYRENTIKSFIRAAELGASFIELDVQVTRDGIPVIWHDDKMLHGTPASAAETTVSDRTYAELRELQPSLLRYFSSDHSSSVAELSSWVVQDDDTLPTLETVFSVLPEQVALNIEVKMTTPDTVPQTSPQEIDRVLAAVVPIIHKYTAGTERTVLLSSFDPDVCAELRRRLPNQHVMFLSDGGADPHADPRRQSLAAALDVATEFDLDGVVVDTDMLRQQPSIVQNATIQGLRVLTYGRANDDPEWVLQQAQLGVHAAIVDDVLRVVASTLKAARAPQLEFARSML